MRNTARRPKITVADEGSGIMSRAGALLLTETARITGLAPGLPAGLAHHLRRADRSRQPALRLQAWPDPLAQPHS